MLTHFFAGGLQLLAPTVIPPPTVIGTLLRRVNWLDNSNAETLYGAWIYPLGGVIPSPLPNTPDVTGPANSTSMDFGPYDDGTQKIIYIAAGIALGGGLYQWSPEDGIQVDFFALSAPAAPSITSLVKNPTFPTTNFDVTWSWSGSEATIQRFIVRWRVNGSGDPYSTQNVSKTLRAETISGLVAGTTYEVQVGAQNSAGTTYSSSSTVTLDSATVPATPTFHSVTWTGAAWTLLFTQNDAADVEIWPEYRVSPSTTWLQPDVSLRFQYSNGGPKTWNDLLNSIPGPPNAGETWEWRMRAKRDGLFSPYSGTVSDTI